MCVCVCMYVCIFCVSVRVPLLVWIFKWYSDQGIRVVLVVHGRKDATIDYVDVPNIQVLQICKKACVAASAQLVP